MCQTPEPAATTEEEAAPSIEGVWTAEEVETVGGPEEGINSSPQPSLYIFTERYYSVMLVNSTEPRSLFETATPSDAEIVKAYATFTANSGTYELEGSNIMFHPSVAKDPNFMSGGSVSYEYQLEGDTLSLVFRPDQLVVPGIEYQSEATETRYKLRRLE